MPLASSLPQSLPCGSCLHALSPMAWMCACCCYALHVWPPCRFLAEVLGLQEYRFDARSAVRLDYASYALE